MATLTTHSVIPAKAGIHENRKLNLPIQECFRKFDESFDRIKYFSCITQNCNVNNLPSEWSVKNSSGLSYDVAKPPKDQKEKIMQGYKHFIACYLVNDCINTFAICLDKLCLNLLLHNKSISSSETPDDVLARNNDKAFLNDFEQKGISAKVISLEKKFQLTLPASLRQIAKSFNELRNCLLHRAGIVSGKDGEAVDGNENKRKFYWITYDIFGVDEVTKEQIAIEFTKPVENDTTIYLKEKREHFKEFNVGEQLSFSFAEAYEIAASLWCVAHTYIQEVNTKILANSS